MSNMTNVGRQYALFLEQAFDFEDLAAAPVKLAPKLPVGAIVLSTRVITETIFNGATPTLDVGVAGSLAKYANDASLAAAAVVNGAAVTGTPLTAEETIVLTPNAGAAASTAGKGRVVVEYIVVGRANEMLP
ncbi:hypothetical protein [Caldimonas sp. KR1-144]|uniref:hypothetical protein n=1 Tax=Caldimonas sp. KR1-144 TaxID=3400911 RepID=UPI003C0B8DBE